MYVVVFKFVVFVSIFIIGVVLVWVSDFGVFWEVEWLREIVVN